MSNEINPFKATSILRRFKHDEKMLGPEEQAALDFAISVITEKANRDNQPVCSICGSRDLTEHHPLCSTVTAAFVGLNTIVNSSDWARRKEIAESIRTLLKNSITRK